MTKIKSIALTHKIGVIVIDIKKLKTIMIMAFFFIDALIVLCFCHSTMGGPNLG